MLRWIASHWRWFDPATSWCEMGRCYERRCECWEKAMAALDAMVWASGEVAKATLAMANSMDEMARFYEALTGAEKRECP